MADVEILNVSKAYGAKRVLRGFSLAVPGGGATCLMGPSGCGKTTLLRLIAGLETPDAGEIRGADRRRLAYVFQEDRLINHVSALKNVQMVSDGGTAERLLSALGLSESARTPVSRLSGGMARRVAIARALAADAELILMDEPFKGLDKHTRARVIDAVRAETAGKTLLVVTHDAEEAALLGGRVVDMGARGSD